MEKQEILDSLNELPVETWIESNYLYKLIEGEEVKKKLQLLEKIKELGWLAYEDKKLLSFILMSSFHHGIKTMCICDSIAKRAEINYRFVCVDMALRTLAQTKYIRPRMRAWFALSFVLPDFHEIDSEYLLKIDFPDDHDVLSLIQKRLNIAQEGPSSVKSWALAVLMPGLLENGCDDMRQKIRKVVEEFCPPPLEFVP